MTAEVSAQRIDDLVEDVAGLIIEQDDLLHSYREINNLFDSLKVILCECIFDALIISVSQNNGFIANDMNLELIQSHFS